MRRAGARTYRAAPIPYHTRRKACDYLLKWGLIQILECLTSTFLQFIVVDSYLVFTQVFVVPARFPAWVASLSRLEYLAMWTDVVDRTKELFSQAGRNRLADACANAERVELEAKGVEPAAVEAAVASARRGIVASLEAQTGAPCTAAHPLPAGRRDDRGRAALRGAACQ